MHASTNTDYHEIIDRIVEIFTGIFINLVYVLGKRAFIEFYEMITGKSKKEEINPLYD